MRRHGWDTRRADQRKHVAGKAACSVKVKNETREAFNAPGGETATASSAGQPDPKPKGRQTSLPEMGGIPNSLETDSPVLSASPEAQETTSVE